jgi:hypothetical protein
MKNLNFKDFFIFIAILALLIIGYFLVDMRGNYKNELQMREKLENALSDTMRTNKDKFGRLRSEKLTMQGEIDDLKKRTNLLNEEKRQLLSEVENLNKEKEVIAAALFEAEATIDSLLNTTGVVINDSTYSFSDSTQHYNYRILVGNITPYLDYKPFLLINNFTITTDYLVSFNWEKNRREFYPVSFNVTPTNPFIRINGIESYAIPELQKQIVKPTGWKKFGNFFKERWEDLLIGGISFGVGYGIGSSR